MSESLTVPQHAQFAHWADQTAAGILRARPGPHVVATGITPSGPIHLGNLREVLTADAIYRALLRQGAEATLIYIADTFDPLRHVYPFLPASYQEHVGKPLFAIPDPEGCCESYAEHYLGPFLRSLETLGIRPVVYRAHELYASGVYREVARETVARRDRIAGILSDVSGRALPGDWFPFNPRCGICGRLSGAKVVSVSEDGTEVRYRCAEGHEGKAGVETSEGKLPWRIDWPARWKALGVTVEPFGKDHAAAGGSYDTGSLLSREVFGYDPPHPVVYEWIYLKGKGAMAGSTGVAISVAELLEVLPPEVVRFFVVRSRPEKHIEFDPPGGMAQVIEDYQEVERAYFSPQGADAWQARVYELSQVDGPPAELPLQVPLSHLAIASQTASGDMERTLEILERTGYPVRGREAEARRHVVQANVWVNRYAPKDFRFEVSPQLPQAVGSLSKAQREFLAALADVLDRTAWEAEAIHTAAHEEGRRLGLSPKEAFSAIYLSLVGKNYGPRAGYFLSSLEKGFVVGRFRQAGQAA